MKLIFESFHAQKFPAISRNQPIMLIFYTYYAMLQCSNLCSILCSCKRFVFKNLAVLLEYIHLHHKILMHLHTTVEQIIIVDVLLEYIDLQSYFQSSTTYYALCWHNRLVPSYKTYHKGDIYNNINRCILYIIMYMT